MQKDHDKFDIIKIKTKDRWVVSNWLIVSIALK